SADEQREARRQYRVVLATFFWCFFLLGLNDGSIGPLLPVYQDFYHVSLRYDRVSCLLIILWLSFLIVSMIFISNCLTCLTCGLERVDLEACRILKNTRPDCRFSNHCLLHPLWYSFIPSNVHRLLHQRNGNVPPQLPMQLSSFHAAQSNRHGPRSCFLRCRSSRCTLALPPVCRLLHANHATNWSLYYTILIGASLSNFVSFVTILRGAGYEEVLKGMDASQQEEIDLRNSTSRTESANDAVDVAQTETKDSAFTRSSKEGNTFGMVLKQVHVHVLAAFVFIYVGVEVTIGGWIVTFMINERGGGPSAGYVSSGFFGGLALGRVALLKVTQLLGDRNAIFLYVALGVILEITIWFVPSLIGNAIAISLVGMMLGPFYPIVMNQTGRIIPRKVLSGSIGWIAGFGQSGSAVLPFLTGALANKYGIVALQPLIVAMMASMAALWFMVPTIAKRKE
ncbi:MFS general substrate transporter, partial [Serendipita vermifera]